MFFHNIIQHHPQVETADFLQVVVHPGDGFVNFNDTELRRSHPDLLPPPGFPLTQSSSLPRRSPTDEDGSSLLSPEEYPYFDIHYSIFDIRFFKVSFPIRPAFYWPAVLTPDT